MTIPLLFSKWSGGRPIDDAGPLMILQFRQFLINTFQAGDDLYISLPKKTRKEIEKWIEKNKPVINEAAR